MPIWMLLASKVLQNKSQSNNANANANNTSPFSTLTSLYNNYLNKR